jgi:urease accessory protein
VLEILERVHSREDGDLRSGELGPIVAWLTLPYEIRQKSRFRARLDQGDEAFVVLPRGTLLRDGDVLVATDGSLVGVRAAPETVSVASAADGLSLLRGAYHLGNRHVTLQIAEHQLVYQHDHVLDAMLERFGLRVTQHSAPFEPEAGAYHAHSHAVSSHAHDTANHPESTIPESYSRQTADGSAVDPSDIPTQVEFVKRKRQQW